MPVKEVKAIIIDDNQEFLDFAESYVESIGGIKVVAKVLSGEEGLERTKRLRPDLVLVDLAMPGLNGLAVTKELKTLPYSPRVIVVTMYDDEEYRKAAQEVGADAFVTKAEIDVKLARIVKEMFPSGEGMRRILIVDDSPTMRKMIMAALLPLGKVIFHEAGNGLEAIEQLALHRIDLVSLDLNMPDMHGLEVLKFIKSHAAYRLIPVVVVTTKRDDISRKEVLAGGASAMIAKPFDPRALAQLVESLLLGEKNNDVR